MTADSRKIAEGLTANYPMPKGLKHFLSTREQIVQRILKVRGALGELLAHLSHVFLVALLNLFLEKLLQRTVSQAVLPLLRKVGHEIGDQRSGQTLRLCVGIVGEEGIDRGPRRRRSSTRWR
jgi:hypothetical protein